MIKLNKQNSIYLLSVLLFLIVISILNKNFVINILFFISLCISLAISNEKGLYDYLYNTLLVSAIFEYTAYLANYEKIYLFHVVLIIVSLFALYKLVKENRLLNILKIKELYFYVIWFIYMILSIFWAINRSLSIKYIAIYIMMFLFLFNIIVYNSNENKLKNSIKILGTMFIIIILIGMFEALTGLQLPVKHYYDSIMYKLSQKEISILSIRPVVFSFNSNNYATVLGLFIPFALYLFYMYKDKKSKAISFIIVIITYTLIILTTSRANIFAIVMIVFLFTVLSLKQSKWNIKSIVYPLIICITFVFIYKFSYLMVNSGIEAQQKMSEKMTNFSKIYTDKVEIGEEGSENVRATILFDVTSAVFKEHHYFGYGVGNTYQLLLDKKNTHGIYSPHGLAIELLGDFGIPLILLYGAFYIYILTKLYLIGIRAIGYQRWIAFSLLTSLFGFLMGSFSPSSVTYFLTNWLVFGLAISVIQIYSNNRAGIENE